MRTTHGSGQSRTHFSTSSFLSTLVGKWREYRMLRDAESLPYSVMKDIGFRASETTNVR